jgi:hypothetical protein
MAPFGKGGGPKDRRIFASNRHFHKRRKVRKGEIQNESELYAFSGEILF